MGKKIDRSYVWRHPLVFDAHYYYQYGICGHEQPHYPVPALLPSDSIADAMYGKGWEANV